MSIERALARAERRGARLAARLLWRSLGAFGFFRTLGRLVWSKAKREPFRELGPPEDERERLSRRQTRDIIILFRALRAEVGSERALELCRELVVRAGLTFLDEMIPASIPDDAEALATELAGQFFNAEGDVEIEGDRVLKFNVRRCRFVEIFARVGHSELAPLFCAVDSAFFESGRRPIRLGRTKTLARGGSECDFVFTRTDRAGASGTPKG